MPESGPLSLIDWGVAVAAPLGEAESGDLHVVKALSGGVLIAVIDGLGHGAEAARAARMAEEVIEEAPEEPLTALMERCHGALRRSRGAVMSLAEIETDTAEVRWTGVGNVEIRLLHTLPGGARTSSSPTLMGGVVGYQLPALRETSAPIARGDVLIFVTDGVRSSFAEQLSLATTPQRIAESILERDGKGSDDALALVARYLGARSG